MKKFNLILTLDATLSVEDGVEMQDVIEKMICTLKDGTGKDKVEQSQILNYEFVV